MATKKCPSCKKTKDVSKFGARIVKGKPYLQPWCTKCRHKTRSTKAKTKRKSKK